MTTEELNLKLYEKMKEELDNYRAKLETMPPQEILRNAYEYVIKEDIVYCLEENELGYKDALTLLKSNTPLNDVYMKYEHSSSIHMEELMDAIEARAHEVQREEWKRNREEAR